MNLATIESRLYERLTFQRTLSDAEVISRLRGYINTVHLNLMGRKQMARYRRRILSFTSIANSPYITTPQAVSKIHVIVDRTNRKRLDEISLMDLRQRDPGNSYGSSFPYAYTILDYSSPIHTPILTSGRLYAKSTSASDGGTKTAYAEGVSSGGFYRSDSVALNGTTQVEFVATYTDWAVINKFYIELTAGGATSAAGVVSLLDGSAAGPPSISDIPRGLAHARYTMLQLYPYPTAAVTYHVDAQVHVEDMGRATDQPLLPEEFHNIIIEGALMLDYERREKATQYAQAKARFREIWSELCMYTDRMNEAEHNTPAGTSQLGAYYEAGT